MSAANDISCMDPAVRCCSADRPARAATAAVFFNILLSTWAWLDVCRALISGLKSLAAPSHTTGTGAAGGLGSPVLPAFLTVRGELLLQCHCVQLIADKKIRTSMRDQFEIWGETRCCTSLELFTKNIRPRRYKLARRIKKNNDTKIHL